MSSRDDYRLLIEKLDQFIRKYYINQMIRGALYSTALIVVFFLLIAYLEYSFYFDTGIRRLMFFSFLGISLFAIGGWVALPILHYFRLGKIISHEKAATIIGNHFSNVKDKLLNILQLRHQADSASQKELILASINQKSAEIQPVPFKSAINLAQNRKYLRYALPPLLLLIVLLFAAPSMIKDSTNRLFHSGQKFERPAPFHFVLEQDELSVVQFSDFPLTVKIEGDQLPAEVFIDVDNYQYRLTKVAPNEFSYQFNNVQKDVEFKLFSSGVESDDYTLAVLKKPNILGFELKLDYPAYTQRNDETLNSIGDVTVPVGTHIDWIFNAENTDAVQLRFSGSGELLTTNRFSDDLFSYKKQAMQNETYKLYVSNSSLPNADSIGYTLSIVPDLYPSIKAEQFVDSTDKKLSFFVGDASDDYGLSSLSFNYRVKPAEGAEGDLKTIPLNLPKGKEVRFDHTFDLKELSLKPGDEVTYYFEVYDNDGVHGAKAARTNVMVYAVPTVDEFQAMAEQNDKKIKDQLQKSLEESKKLQEDVKEMREKLLQEKEMDWQSRKELEKLMERQKELEKQMEEAKEAYEENLKNQEEFTEMDERIMEKQEKLQELFEEVMSEDMKELMEQIEEMLQEMEKENALEMMEDFEMNDEELEKELDRLYEMFKQLEVEQEMQDMIEQLEEMAEQQEELSEQTQNEDLPQEELQEKQSDLQEKMEKMEEKMESLQEKNSELENPKEIDDQQQQMDDVQQQMEQSQDQMQQQQNQKASESQKKAAEQMREMAMQMQMQMQQQEMEQMQEDMQALRQLLENLVGLSFDQEDLIDEFAEVNINTPRYVELVQDQFKLQDDFRLIEDSLQALSKRVFQIESYVTEKVTEIKDNMNNALDDLEERRKPQAGDHQQRAMTNVNDLALMLSETMNQMQQQMSGMMQGNQMCTKPGGQGKQGQQPQDKLSPGQQGVNEQMQRLRDQLKSGKGASSRDFAQLAARQAALRKALREKQNELQKQGKGSKELEDIIQQMDKTETELVNKQLSNETMKRQEDILTRLLEHEKAEREREFDKKRQAESGTEKERKIPPSMEEYLKKRQAEIEMYKAVSPSLKPYYKYLVEEYLKSLKSE
ncbi:MAG: DUF4175 family protein [Saprospiraceae bacterium]|nr:DUF4175 domain-containing protein [Lewinella sp.]